MKVACVVPSAGKGSRLNAGKDKPFIKLNGKPLLFHTLSALSQSRLIDDIIVVVSEKNLKACGALVKKYKLNRVRAVVCGGKRRFDSVKNGLAKAENADLVLIHDGARPFVDKKLIRKVILEARSSGAALPAIPSRQTLKKINKNSFVENTPDRKYIWEAQTPQGFRKNLILKAYKMAKNRAATDDAALAERLGHKVKIVKGSYRNIKITTPEDLELAKALMKSERL